jgi:hypothetical protein
MKSKLFFPALLLAGLMLASLSVNQVYGQTPQNKPVKQQEAVKYTCPQHPEVVQDKAGTCPKCGMTLVDQKSITKGNMNQKCDSTKMKKSDKKVKCDSTDMKKM